jgi:LPS-assembly lipoprotein
MLALSGCGLHLHGMGEGQVTAFRFVNLVGASPVLTQSIQQTLALRGAARLSNLNQAELQIIVRDESQDKQVLSLNRFGQVSEYQLRYTVVFDIYQPDGQMLLEKQSIYLQHALPFTENAILAKEREELQINQGMLQDAAEQILRRLDVLAHRTLQTPVNLIPDATITP